jgi:cytochrome P450
MNLDPPNHARLRRLAAAAFSPRRLEIYRAQIQSVANIVLSGIDSTGVVDLIETFSHPFTFQSLCEVFGVPHENRADLDRWMSCAFSRTRATNAEAERNMDDFETFIREEIQRRRVEPGPDMISSLTSAWEAERNATEDEIVSLCAMLMLAGFESTMQMIGFGVVGLLTHLELYAQLRANPDLIPQAVEELLRWDTPGPFSTARLATENITCGDTIIPQGSIVILSIAAANRDPSRHERPDMVDFERRTAGHLAFGIGPHYCVGAALARLELSIGLASLIEGPEIELAVSPGDLAWRGNHTFRRLANLPVLLGSARSNLAAAWPHSPSAEDSGRRPRR